MKEFEPFLAKISQPDHQQRTKDVLSWINQTYPNLETVIKWNQPMFTDHGTFIIGFSVSKKHLALSPETVTIKLFAQAIEQAGYSYTDNIVRINWDQEVDYQLLKKMIDFNIADKAEITQFWR